MTNLSGYERNGQFRDPLEPTPLLHRFGDTAGHRARVEAIVEDMAATVGHYGFTIEEPGDRSQIFENLRSPAETASPADGEYTQPMQGFPLTMEGYSVLLRSLSQEIPPVPIDEPPVA